MLYKCEFFKEKVTLEASHCILNSKTNMAEFALLCEAHVCLCGLTYLLFIWEFSRLRRPLVGADKSELWKNNSSPTTY